MTELEAKAAEAWACIVRPITVSTRGFGNGPMPAAVALDMVQDVTGDRDDAVGAIVRAGADWLDTQTVPWLGSRAYSDDAELVRNYLRSEGLKMASLFAAHIKERADQAADPRASSEEKWAAHEWGRWADKATFAIDTCRAVVDAAYPKPATEEAA